MRIGKNKAEALRRRPAPGDEHSQRLFPGGPFPSEPAETSKSIESASTRGSGLPYAPLAPLRDGECDGRRGNLGTLQLNIRFPRTNVANAQTTALEKKEK